MIVAGTVLLGQERPRSAWFSGWAAARLHDQGQHYGTAQICGGGWWRPRATGIGWPVEWLIGEGYRSRWDLTIRAPTLAPLTAGEGLGADEADEWFNSARVLSPSPVWTTAVLIHEQGGLGWWRRGRWEEGGREGRKKSVIGQNGHFTIILYPL
jgi:hypothetical protein